MDEAGRIVSCLLMAPGPENLSEIRQGSTSPGGCARPKLALPQSAGAAAELRVAGVDRESCQRSDSGPGGAVVAPSPASARPQSTSELDER